MASISSLSGAQSAAQSGLAQLRLQQAKRDADQAEQTAQSLQAQARSAQQRASQAQDTARTITTQADQAQTSAGQARQGLAVIKSVSQMQTRLAGTVSRVAEKLDAAVPAVPVAVHAASSPPATPVVNVQGQVTGTVVNTTA
jgi:hypothetical protein